VFYLAALASGVMLASSGGGEVDLDRLLFGAALALDNTALILTGVAAAASLVVIRVLFRPLLLDTLDPQFLRTSGGPKWAGPLAQAAFFGLLALTTVASFHALGALMSIGLTILPAIAARFWAKGVVAMMAYACVLGWIGVIMGLLTSFYGDAPAGAAIVASLVAIVLLSSLIGPVNSVASRHLRLVALVS
jgi:zinc/manganese transport system permease protein